MNTISVSEARKVLLNAGISVGQRGRLSAEAKAAVQQLTGKTVA